MEAVASESPIFVVGMPRSGTTLVRTLLSAHPRIAIASETHYLTKFASDPGSEPLADGSDFERFWEALVRSERFRSLDLDPESVRARLEETGEVSHRAVFRSILIAHADRHDKPRWGEKTPHHYRYLDRLLEWFPEARVLFMTRDPRAICSSLMDVYWRTWNGSGLRRLEPTRLTRLRRIYHDAELWKAQMGDVATRWSGDDRVRVVRYENLVGDARAELESICGFLGETYTDSMVNDRDRERASGHDEVQRNWRRRHLSRTAGPITRESVDKWRKNLAAGEIRMIESICGDAMGRFGYQTREDVGSLPARVRLGLGKRLCAGYWKVVGQGASD